jgi:hypothetical protein
VHCVAEEREAIAGLLADLGRLTARQREALVLRELAGLDYTELAEALDTTPLAARQAVFAARAALRDQHEGREMPCEAVRLRLADGDRRTARGAALRAHLRGCDDCHGFVARSAARDASAGRPVPRKVV